MAAAAVATNIAGGEGPAYVTCALPYRNDVNGREVEWGLDTALAIVEEAVNAFDPPCIEPRPVRTSWPAELQEKAKDMDTFEMMRSVYFARSSKSLPEIHRSVPKIEADFYMWLACRKQQWRAHRSGKRARRQLTPEDDFPRWLQQRKWFWKSTKMEREARNTPPLEVDFYRWLAERKKVWRLQRMTKRHAAGRGLMSIRNGGPSHGGGGHHHQKQHSHAENNGNNSGGAGGAGAVARVEDD